MTPTSDPALDDGPLGILAGNGGLPLEVADEVSRSGRPVHIVGIKGEADPAIARHSHTWIELAKVGGLLRAFRTAGCREMVILGGVRRPDVRAARPDLGFFLHLPAILGLMRGGDDSVLRRVVRFFEHNGFRVVGAHEIARGLVADAGLLAGREATEEECQDIAAGLSLIEELGAADVGQAVVVAHGRPVAIEAAEGTDAMLARLTAMRRDSSGGFGGVLVKAAKPGQELRVDLPAIGPRTVDAAAAAGLTGIAIAAGQVLLAERPALLDRARQRRVFLRAVDAPLPPGGVRFRPRTAGRDLECLIGRPGRREREDAARALLVMAAAPAEATVVARRHVLAVEAGEGVRAMLDRVRKVRQWGDQRSLRRRGILAIRWDSSDLDAVARLAAETGLAGILLAGRGGDRMSADAIERIASDAALSLLAAPATKAAADRGVRVCLIAGEHSGDALGARLMQALRDRLGDRVTFSGVGGEQMQQSGLASLFPLSDVAVMGPLSILPRLPRIVRRVYATAAAVTAQSPDVVVIIDSPEFTHPIAKRVRKRRPDIPIVNYVSPSVWAWRPGRARRMRRYIDHVMALLPFEPAAHARLSGPPCTYVGHPLIERLDWLASLDPAPLAERLHLGPGEPVLVVLPGSRLSEVGRLMQPFGEVVRQLQQRGLTPRIVIPAVAHVRQEIEGALAAWPVTAHIVDGEEDKFRAFKLATAALAASGTVTLELALVGVPAVVAYRVDPLAARLRFLVKVPSIVLANLVLGEPVYPEFLQDDCTPDRLASALGDLLGDTCARRRQIELLAGVPARMKLSRGKPSEAAASIVIAAAESRWPQTRLSIGT